MIRRQGARLSAALNGPLSALDVVAGAPELRAAAAEVDPLLPVVLQVEGLRPAVKERWPAFKQRVLDRLGDLDDQLVREIGAAADALLVAGSSVAVSLTQSQIDVVQRHPLIMLRFADLDPLVPVVAMDSVRTEVDAAALLGAGGGLGAGVTVALLDSGVDAAHPALEVADAVETCGEPTEIPGVHGTHCAGIIASRDPIVRGIAPDVRLIDVKVLRANGTGRNTAIGRGVDEALDRGVDILSMSLGFNHLPTSQSGGHGWSCPDGTCPLCLAVDNAVAQGVLVVVAAGNEHERCQQARMGGSGLAYDTELTCPGQAVGAITVGSHHKKTFAPAWSSSSGPAADGRAKPDLCAPGVDVLSTIPLPRDVRGGPRPDSARALWFGVRSGTSMAAPVVAGAAALLIEAARAAGRPHDPISIRTELMTRHVESLAGPANVVGAGRLRLGATP